MLAVHLKPPILGISALVKLAHHLVSRQYAMLTDGRMEASSQEAIYEHQMHLLRAGYQARNVKVVFNPELLNLCARECR